MQLSCPDAIWYLPTSQEVQDANPVVFAIVPAVHTVHVSAAASEYFPSSHSLQLEAPDPLYLPASHDRHAVALGDEYVPASQSEQLDSPDALILPPSHASQLVWPVAPWYRPASHASQEIDPFLA